jgi:membrane protein
MGKPTLRGRPMQVNEIDINGDHPSGGGRQRRYEGRAPDLLYNSPVHSKWNLRGVPVWVVATRTWNSLIADRLVGHAAELAFYFLFALFPALFCASSMLGLAARSAHLIYDRLLNYLALLIPTGALGTVLETFNQTAAASTPGKAAFGLIAAIWSASVGVSAIQDTLNVVYKIQDRRSYMRARIYAIGLTILLIMIVTGVLASMLGGDVGAALAIRTIHNPFVAVSVAVTARIVAWTIATALLSLTFAVTYYWAPDFRQRRWRWLTPGGGVGIVGWLLASLGLRSYIHFFKSFSPTYGSLGAVIVLLTWFYITGLMLLLGAAINSEIDAVAAETRPVGSPAPSAAAQNVDA